MKKIKIGLLALALGSFIFQSCGSEENTETTSVDSTTMAVPADNTGDGISDADPLTQRIGDGNGEGSNGTTTTGNNGSSGVGVETMSSNDGDRPVPTVPGSDDATVKAQNRGGDYNKPNKAGVKNPPEIDRHLNKDSVNNRSGLGTSR